MKVNPLKKLETPGQSIWPDYIQGDPIASGELTRLIDKDGLQGMTSIVPDTVNTVPLETINAYREHGDPRLHLEDEGVKKSDEPFDQLMDGLRKKSTR